MKFSKKARLVLLILSIFITMPICGFLFKFNPMISGLIYLSQLGSLIQVIREWYKSKDIL